MAFHTPPQHPPSNDWALKLMLSCVRNKQHLRQVIWCQATAATHQHEDAASGRDAVASAVRIALALWNKQGTRVKEFTQRLSDLLWIPKFCLTFKQRVHREKLSEAHVQNWTGSWPFWFGATILGNFQGFFRSRTKSTIHIFHRVCSH